MKLRQLGICAAIVAILALTCWGCGGGGSSSSSSETGETSEGQAAAAAEFITPGGNNTIPKFGSEAEPAEREAVSAIIEENLKAREEGDFAGQCASLSAEIIKQLETETESGPAKVTGGCAQHLKAAADVADARANGTPSKAAAEAEGRKGKGPPYIRKDTLTGPIDAFRVKGDTGYALYHGAGGLDYSMVMKKEGGEWKVGALITTEP